MVEGDKWEMFIPSYLAYVCPAGFDLSTRHVVLNELSRVRLADWQGDGGRPPKIGGGDCLIFTMEIIKIKGGSKPKTEL